MQTEQFLYPQHDPQFQSRLKEKAQWVLVFGTGKLLTDPHIIKRIGQMYPNAYLMGCSTSGEIYKNSSYEGCLSVTAIFLEKSNVQFKSFHLEDANHSYTVGEQILSKFDPQDLKHLFILSEGVSINGSKLIEGIRSKLTSDVTITGGLSGDGTAFKKTYILDNRNISPNKVLVAGIYGDIKIGCGAYGGWDTFGIERIATKSFNNVLFELDGKPALDLYKQYLGDQSKNLPASAMLFPLRIRLKDTNESIVRTVLGVNEEQRSLVFAGDIPEKSYCKLMKSNFHHLIEGAIKAGMLATEMIHPTETQLAILVSCVGRKLVLKQRVDEEIEGVREIIGSGATITGFYSYGEIAPHRNNTPCELHNQTMTVTLLSEE
jgi:hypothetical protein